MSATKEQDINIAEPRQDFTISNADMAALKAFSKILDDTVEIWRHRSSFMKELINKIERY